MQDEQHEPEDFGLRRNALALRLQQRRSRKVLADQGIIPPLKSPGTFFEQVQKLERAHKEKFLNKAIQIRPIRDELVQKHILEDTNASSAIVAHQKDLKKAQLVDDLNDKIAFRPGVIELVERNIIPATEPFHEALKGGHIQYKKISDLVDEDSSEALSPEQPPPPPTSSPPLVLQIATSLPATLTTIADRPKSEGSCLMKSPSSSSLFSQNSSHPYLSRQLSKGAKLSQSGSIPRITTSRKKKEKPKFKKFKYHQYVPPDQQQGKTTRLLHPHEIDDDTPYSRLLQQQQLYLQLQIMNKQYNQRSGDAAQQTGSFSQKGIGPPPPPPMSQMMKSDKPRSSSQLTLSKLEEMKVSELKEELKFRRLKVTGTKEVLVERLKPFCVDSENPFLADLQIGDDNSSTGAYVTAGSPTTMNDVTFQAVAQENHAMQPIITQGITLSPNNSEQVGSNDAGPSTAFTIDPNTVFTHRVARMPIPEQHKIVLKQEKFTMPTWHSNIQDARVVTMVTSHAPTTSFSFPEAVDVNKDKLLEKQQKEINDLRRMVELHRSQLIKLQEHQSPELEGQQSENLQQQLQQQQQAFEFSQAAINNHRSQPAVQFCSSNPSTARQTSTASQPYNSPPNYDQAYEMMSEGDSRNHHQHENVNRQMDDLLELLADNGELPSTPVVTRQRLNDHSSYQGLNESTMRHRHHHGYAHQQQQHSQLPSNEYGSVIAQERAQLQQEIAQQQQQKSYSHRGSRDFASPDVAKMLVETAGDALMDTSSFPPVINSTLNDRGAEQPLNYSRASARNSVDSGIIYSNSHYSPMDTNLDGSSKDLFTDLRLSSSSLDSGEPTLNTVSLSPATPPRPKPYLQSTFRPHPSPRSTHNHLVKSASQELLSTSDNSTTGNHQMDNKLGWLDLTLGSAVGGPPSPGGPFGNMNFEEGHPQHNRYHQAMSYNAFHENESILGVGGSTGALNINPGLGGNGVEQWDPWDGILESNFNT